MVSMQLVKYTILCTGETKMCKLTKNLPIHGYPLSREVVGFSEFRGEDFFYKGEGKNAGG